VISDRWTGMGRMIVETIASGGRQGAIESPRPGRETMVMVAINCVTVVEFGGGWVDAGFSRWDRSSQRTMPCRLIIIWVFAYK
jgi:hypothetical protein